MFRLLCVLLCGLLSIGSVTGQTPKSEESEKKALLSQAEHNALNALTKLGCGFSELRGDKRRWLVLPGEMDDASFGSLLPHLQQLTGPLRIFVRCNKITEKTVHRFTNIPALREVFLCEMAVTGPMIQALSHVRSLHSLDLRGSILSAKGYENLHLLQRLCSLTLERIEETRVRRLSHLPTLETLKLPSSAITNEVVDVLCERGLLHILIQCQDAKGRRAKSMETIHSFDLSDSAVTDDGLKALSNLTNLRSLNLSGTGLTDRGFAYLKCVTGLRAIDARGIPITDRALSHFRHCSELRSLKLDFCKVTNVGVQHLISCARLERLSLQRTQITDPALADLGNLRCLCSLNLAETKITKRGLYRLEHLTNLTELNIPSELVDDEVLSWLLGRNLLHAYPGAQTKTDDDRPKTLSDIHRLHLFETQVSARGLRLLQCLPNLKVIGLDGHKLTDEALATLIDMKRAHCLYQVKTSATPSSGDWDVVTGFDLSNSRVTDAGLKSLVALPSLTRLQLPHGITVNGLKHLLALDKLRVIQFASPLTDDMLVSLDRLGLLHKTHASGGSPQSVDEIRSFTLDKANLTGRGMRVLQSLPSLETLKLSACTIDETGWATIQEMTGLRSLSVCEMPITTEKLARLARLRDLKTLHVESQHLTAEDISTLRKRLPKCKIDWHPPLPPLQRLPPLPLLR